LSYTASRCCMLEQCYYTTEDLTEKGVIRIRGTRLWGFEAAWHEATAFPWSKKSYFLYFSNTLYNKNKNTYSHGDIEEYWQQKFVVDCHGNEFTLVEFWRCLAYYDAQSNSPNKEHHFYCKHKEQEKFDKHRNTTNTNVTSKCLYPSALALRLSGTIPRTLVREHESLPRNIGSESGRFGCSLLIIKYY